MMKKMIKAGLCAAAAIVLVSGCGNSSKNAETTAAETSAAGNEAAAAKSEEELSDEAEISVGNYKGLLMTAQKAEVTEEQIDRELEYLMTQYPAEVTGRAAKEGDVANIDYVGTKDGVAFAGGTASGYDLTLGSGDFIDGFEDGVIGMMPGEEKDLNLTFPENYGNADLAGQAVVFHVTLNRIKSVEATKLDDALARRALGDENADFEALKAHVTENLKNRAESDFFNNAGGELLAQVVENSEITCDPDAVEKMFNELESTYTSYASQYGMKIEDFLSTFLGTDLDGLRESAENLVKQEMVLNEIQKAENLAATQEQKEKLAQMNYFDNAAQMIAVYGEESADRLFGMGAAYYYLIENAVAANVIETKEETTAAE